MRPLLTSCTLGFRLTSGELSTEESLCGTRTDSVTRVLLPTATTANALCRALTSWRTLSVCVGVLGGGSALGSSVRGRGGVAGRTGVAGVSDWSALVGVAQGEP